MEPFIVGLGIGCLMGIAAAYLVIIRPRDNTPPSWVELLDEQIASMDEMEKSKPPFVVTRLKKKDIVWEI